MVSEIVMDDDKPFCFGTGEFSKAVLGDTKRFVEDPTKLRWEDADPDGPSFTAGMSLADIKKIPPPSAPVYETEEEIIAAKEWSVEFDKHFDELFTDLDRLEDSDRMMKTG